MQVGIHAITCSMSRGPDTFIEAAVGSEHEGLRLVVSGMKASAPKINALLIASSRHRFVISSAIARCGVVGPHHVDDSSRPGTSGGFDSRNDSGSATDAPAVRLGTLLLVWRGRCTTSTACTSKCQWEWGAKPVRRVEGAGGAIITAASAQPKSTLCLISRDAPASRWRVPLSHRLRARVRDGGAPKLASAASAYSEETGDDGGTSGRLGEEARYHWLMS